jgi:hypothetical protein
MMALIWCMACAGLVIAALIPTGLDRETKVLIWYSAVTLLGALIGYLLGRIDRK